MASLLIDCDECPMQGTSTCSECVVTFLCEQGGDAKVFELDEVRAMRLLAGAGLVPELRHPAARRIRRSS